MYSIFGGHVFGWIISIDRCRNMLRIEEIGSGTINLVIRCDLHIYFDEKVDNCLCYVTLSTPIFLNAPCRILKFWMYSCSKFVRNLTRFIGTEPGNNISIYWQYAEPTTKHTQNKQKTNACDQSCWMLAQWLVFLVLFTGAQFFDFAKLWVQAIIHP